MMDKRSYEIRSDPDVVVKENYDIAVKLWNEIIV